MGDLTNQGQGQTGQPDGAQNTGNQNAGTGTTGERGQGNQAQQTFTQADLERILGERLAREREKYKDYESLKKAAQELEKIKQSQMSDLEKAQAKAAEEEKKRLDLERELAEAKLEVMKLKILDELKIPREFADRIFGSNEEELKADAKAFAKLLGEKGKIVGSASSPGASPAPDAVEAMKKLAEERSKRATPTGGYDPWAINK